LWYYALPAGETEGEDERVMTVTMTYWSNWFTWKSDKLVAQPVMSFTGDPKKCLEVKAYMRVLEMRKIR
jgi:hypothetical protein